MKRISILVILGLLVWAGIYLRFFDLGQKPMHTDEAVNAMMVLQTLSGDEVSFDPMHYHGPLLRYLAIITVSLSQSITGEPWSETCLRWLTALAGALSVASIFLLRKNMGRDASFIALVSAAVSPPIIYYNRYFIHESVFILFSLLFLHAVWRFVELRTIGRAIWAGALIGILHAVRETVVLVLAAAIPAVFLAFGRNWRTEFRWVSTKSGLSLLGALLASALITSVLFYSGFFTYWQGPIDSVLTYFGYEAEAGHEKLWYYYLGLIVGEGSPVGYLGQAWILVFGLAGIWKAFFDKEVQTDRAPFFRFVSFYTLITTSLYSLIAYKTPWLVLNFLVGWILLAGIGGVYLWQKWGHWISRTILVLVLLGTLAHSVRQSFLLGFRYSADPRNPFVYSHTSPDLLKLVERIDNLANLHPEGKSMRIDIAGAEYWPLPWYLRDYTQVGYWAELPADSKAPVQVVSFVAGQEVPEMDEQQYMTELRGLREGVFLLIFIDKVLWESQFPDE